MITTTLDGDIARITLQTGSANTMGAGFFADLTRALDEAEAARAIVLTGAGNAFSAGLDLPHLLTLDEPTVAAMINSFSAIMERVFLWPAPVVAALNGHAIAGGFVLAAACDVRLLANGGAKVGMTGVALGIAYPSLVTSMLQYSVPKAMWHRVLLEGRLFSATEAHAASLVDVVHEPADLLARAHEHAVLLGTADRDAYTRTKRMLKAEAVSRARSLADESHAAFTRALFSPPTRARLVAAVEKMKKR